MTSAVLSIEKKTETTKSITPTLTDQTVTPNEGEVFSEVTVAGVTKELVASLDSNFISSNILPDVSLKVVDFRFCKAGFLHNLFNWCSSI